MITSLWRRIIGGLAMAVVATSTAFAEWKSSGTLAVPKYSYSFLASTPRGDVLATTFNSVPAGSPARQLPALLIQNPDSPAPQVVELCRTMFEPQRGYGGIACDSNGSFFVSGDTGVPSSCFVKKFLPNGSPDPTFGISGEIRPNRRTLGVEVLGKHLLLAVDWGKIMVFASDTGRYLTTIEGPKEDVYVRDIAIDPKSMRIFGVAAGAVVTWGQGSPWNPSTYQYRPLSKPYGELRAGEGISIDPFSRTVLITPKPGNMLFEIEGSLKVNRFPVETARANTHLQDTVMSFDGSTVFISDMYGLCIHVMKRPAPQLIAATAAQPASPAAPPVPKAQGTAPAPVWFHSYTDVVQNAREKGKPMIVYFTQTGVKKAQDFEKTVLMTNEFNTYANTKDFVCVYEDVGSNRMTAYKFGAYRVPHVVVLDRHGETAAEFSYDIDANRLLNTMARLQ